MSYLVQILLPTRDNHGASFGPQDFERETRMLTDRFGGATSYMRAPAEGRWKQDGQTEYDEIVVLEVIAAELDRDFWSNYRRDLERRFRQDIVIIRSQDIELL